MQFRPQRRGYCMASDRMLQFVEREQSYPDKRSAEERARDFHEIAERYAAPDADAQAARCSQCGVPYCSVHCRAAESEEHTSELQSLMRTSYAVFCSKKKKNIHITKATS